MTCSNKDVSFLRILRVCLHSFKQLRSSGGVHWRQTHSHIWHLILVRWHPTPVLLPGKPHGRRSLVVKSWTRLSYFPFTFHFHALEKEMATHSSSLAWRIPGTAEPGGLTSMGSHRVGHDWSDLAVAAGEYIGSPPCAPTATILLEVYSKVSSEVPWDHGSQTLTAFQLYDINKSRGVRK